MALAEDHVRHVVRVGGGVVRHDAPDFLAGKDQDGADEYDLRNILHSRRSFLCHKTQETHRHKGNTQHGLPWL